jgi:hypothetical protein
MELFSVRLPGTLKIPTVIQSITYTMDAIKCGTVSEFFYFVGKVAEIEKNN